MARRVRAVAVATTAVVVLLLCAASAQAVPSVTYKCTPAPADCSGWFRSDVSIKWTVVPSDATVVSGCQATTLSTDTTGTNVFCSADDGSATVTVQLKLHVDMTPPVVTGGTPARAADVNGWYDRAVGVTFTGADLTSGIASCTSTTYDGPDSAAASLSGTCMDNAGNRSAPLGYGLKYDETAPAVTAATPERAANANGWFNGPVRFDPAGTDATSGVADCAPVTYAGPDSATAAITATCRDQAGNSATRSFALKYDATAPRITQGSPARTADAGGWYNHAVSVAFTGSDALSGLSACTAPSYSGPDSATASVSGTCTDRAGNVSSPLAVALEYDATKPVVTGGAAGRPPDANGWYDHDVSVGFSGTDATSGVDACTNAHYGGPDTAAASVSGTCRDVAGNVSDPIPFALEYDATGPEVTGAEPARPPDFDGWFTAPVRFDVAGTDAVSGLDACPPVTYSGPDASGGVVTARCRDLAGNSSSREFGLKYDATAPPLTGLSAAGGDGTVAVSWHTTADARSVEVRRTPGVAAADSVVFQGPGAAFVDHQVTNGVAYRYRVTLRDAAGNTTSATAAGTPVAPAVVAVPPPVVPPVSPVTALVTPRRFDPAPRSVFRFGERPLLRWKPVRRARYYNVQLFRGARKVLSVWPAQAHYRLRLRWSFRGEPRRLAAGHYRWMVWPGVGPRAKGRYGKRILSSTFVVRRAVPAT